MIELMLKSLINRVRGNIINNYENKKYIGEIGNKINCANSVKDCLIILQQILFVMRRNEIINVKTYSDYLLNVNNYEVYEEIVDVIDIMNNLLYDYETNITTHNFLKSCL